MDISTALPSWFPDTRILLPLLALYSLKILTSHLLLISPPFQRFLAYLGRLFWRRSTPWESHAESDPLVQRSEPEPVPEGGYVKLHGGASLLGISVLRVMLCAALVLSSVFAVLDERRRPPGQHAVQFALLAFYIYLFILSLLSLLLRHPRPRLILSRHLHVLAILALIFFLGHVAFPGRGEKDGERGKWWFWLRGAGVGVLALGLPAAAGGVVAWRMRRQEREVTKGEPRLEEDA